MGQTTLLYFFSALAQSAAALISVIAVFAVFRLQASGSDVAERYREASFWIKNNGIQDAFTTPRQDIRRMLEEALQEAGSLWGVIKSIRFPQETCDQKKTEIRRLLQAINGDEAFHGNLVFRMALPLKAWAAVFLGSVVMVLVTQWVWEWLGFVLAAALVIGTIVAGWLSKQFVQECLHVPTASQWRRRDAAAL